MDYRGKTNAARLCILAAFAFAMALAGCAKAASPYDASRLSLALTEEPKTLILTGSDFKSIAFKNDRNFPGPVMYITLSDEAAPRFAEATAANIGKRMSIFCDGREITSAVVRSAIDGGKLQLPFMDDGSANELKDLLRK